PVSMFLWNDTAAPVADPGVMYTSRQPETTDIDALIALTITQWYSISFSNWSITFSIAIASATAPPGESITNTACLMPRVFASESALYTPPAVISSPNAPLRGISMYVASDLVD